MNETLTNIRERYSCRAFTGKKLTEEELGAILQAAIQSPSSMNRQRWQVIAVRNEALIAELEAEGTRLMAAMPDKTLYERIQSRGGKLFYNAPCVIYVAFEPGDLASASLDCGIVSQSVALAAQAQGLGSCICGLAALSFAEGKAAEFKQKLKFPAGYEFAMAILVGEAAVEGTPHQPDQTKITVID